MARRDHWLQKQPIDGFVRVIERRQIDFPVPAGEQLVVGDQPVREVVGKEQPAFAARRRRRVLKSRGATSSEYLSCRLPATSFRNLGPLPRERDCEQWNLGGSWSGSWKLAQLEAGSGELEAIRSADRHFAICVARTATAAGVTPGIRDAWPSVAGRTCDSRSTISRESPGIP